MPTIDKVYREIFPGDLPARTSLLVGGLPLGAKFEVDGVAVASGTGNDEIMAARDIRPLFDEDED